jgi:LmbE family N-acetylglucosaminyl deacetylase
MHVVIVIATDGSKGSYHEQSANLTGLRVQEARRAAAVLGAEPPVLLCHADIELDQLRRACCVSSL